MSELNSPGSVGTCNAQENMTSDSSKTFIHLCYVYVLQVVGQSNAVFSTTIYEQKKNIKCIINNFAYIFINT